MRLPICIVVPLTFAVRLREMPGETMDERTVTARRLPSRLLACLVVVGISSGLLPGLLTARQADPRLALIEAIRGAGRETSAAGFLQRIEAADALVPSADMAASDSRKRTALHWSVLSAQSASSAKLKDACRRLVEDLLAAGADVNAEDAYGNTPLDYQQRSPASLLEEILIEQGGQRGYTQTAQARVLHLLDQVRAAERDNDLPRLRSLLESDLPANTGLSVRLLTRVASHESLPGDAVEAVVIAPVEAGGRVVVAPGTKIEGTVLRARRAATRYEQAQLDIDLCNLVHDDGITTPVAALLTEVDNAREQVREGQVVGISFPQSASDRLSWGRSAVGFVHPLLGHALAAAILAWQKGYAEAPVSLLLLDARKPDLVYQKQTNTFARRHHIRMWKSPRTYEGRELWLGAGTHDIGIAVLKGGHAWYHLVDPQVDREQAKVKDDLLFTGRVAWFSWFDRPELPRRSVNATGDELHTQGRLLILSLAEASPRH